MKVSILLRFFIGMTVVLVSCKTRSQEPLANEVLAEFLDDMHSGRYEKATEIYGGTYETLIENNESIDPNDHASLFKNACEINGYHCLAVKSISLKSDATPNAYEYTVEFLNDDGTLFMRGPCCGGSATDFPPESLFLFTVVKSDQGKFVVMELPPYVP